MSSCERVNVVRSRRCFLGVAEVKKRNSQVNHKVIIFQSTTSQYPKNQTIKRNEITKAYLI